jgi:hypothetical protein
VRSLLLVVVVVVENNEALEAPADTCWPGNEVKRSFVPRAARNLSRNDDADSLWTEVV